MDDSNVLLTRQLETSCSYVTVLQNGNSNGNKKTGVCRFHIFLIMAMKLFPGGGNVELLHQAVKPAMIDLEQPGRGHFAASRLLQCADD